MSKLSGLALQLQGNQGYGPMNVRTLEQEIEALRPVTTPELVRAAAAELRDEIAAAKATTLRRLPAMRENPQDGAVGMLRHNRSTEYALAVLKGLVSRELGMDLDHAERFAAALDAAADRWQGARHAPRMNRPQIATPDAGPTSASTDADQAVRRAAAILMGKAP